MTRVYSTFLISRFIVVEHTSLIASPFLLHSFLSFSLSSPQVILLFQSSHFNYFSPWCELCMTAFAQARHWGILAEMICINDGNEGEMTKDRRMIWDRKKEGPVRKNVADETQIGAQMKLIQPFAFQPSINCLYLHQDDFTLMESDLHSCVFNISTYNTFHTWKYTRLNMLAICLLKSACDCSLTAFTHLLVHPTAFTTFKPML